MQWRPAESASLHLHRIGRTARAGCGPPPLPFHARLESGGYEGGGAGRRQGAGPFTATALVDPEEDGARGATALLLEAHARGWESLPELISTRRSAAP